MKEEHQEWISAIESRIIDAEDKIIFREVTISMKSNCFRAAYILSWISLVESLKRKINQYASIGDKNAEAAVEKIEKAEAQKLSVDKLIYEVAKECGIIDDSELSTITFLWERRCLFAHPYEKQPDLEEVKYIITQSINISLGKELQFNKNYIEELCTHIAEKPFYLPNEVEKVQDYAKKIVGRTPEKLYPFFFKTLLFKIEDLKDDETKLYELRKLRYFILEIFLKTSRSLEDPDWGLENRATKYPFESYLGFVHHQIWSKIPDRIKEMLISYFEFEKKVERHIILKAITKNLISENVLEEKYRTRFYRILDKESFDSAIDYYGDHKMAFKRIVNGLETNNYETQNPIIDYLRTDRAVSLISGLDINKQHSLGQLITQAASSGHWKSQHFVNSLIADQFKYSDFVKAGVALGYFLTTKKALRLDYNDIQKGFEIFNAINAEALQLTIEELDLFFESKKLVISNFACTTFGNVECTEIGNMSCT
jgi:hypothetical protein